MKGSYHHGKTSSHTIPSLGAIGIERGSALAIYSRAGTRLYWLKRSFEVRGEESAEKCFCIDFLGSPDFINWAKEKLIDPKNADTRNIPVLRELVDSPSLEQMGRTTESIIGRKVSYSNSMVKLKNLNFKK